MEQNNQNTNTCSGGEQKCGCSMCQKCGWCPSACLKIRGHKIAAIIIIILVLIFIGKMFCGDSEERNNKIANTISFSGKGEVMIKPDIATVSLSSSAEDLDISKATELVNKNMTDITNSLKANGVDEKDIKTTDYSIYPRYDYLQTPQIYPYTGKQVLAAYVVTQSIDLKIRDLTKASKIISDLGKLKVSNMSGLTFTVDNDQAFKDQARDLAIEDAKAQAKVLAKSLGIRLLKITNFSEGGNYPVMYNYANEKSAVMGMGGDIAPTISTGMNKITSNVSITYEIK